MKTTILILSMVVLAGCATHQRPVIAPALSSVSVPLARARDAIKTARDRLDAGDVPAAKAAIALADAKADESARALESKDEEIGKLVKAVQDTDAEIVLLKRELHQVAKERDIIPYIVALVVALWFMGLADAIPVASQYRIWIKGAAFVVGFGSGYGAGRLLVRAIATFLP